MIVDEKQREVFVLVLRVRLTVYHRVAVLTINAFFQNIYQLTFLRLLSLTGKEHLLRLLLCDALGSRHLLHLCLLTAKHLLKHPQVLHVQVRHLWQQWIVI